MITGPAIRNDVDSAMTIMEAEYGAEADGKSVATEASIHRGFTDPGKYLDSLMTKVRELAKEVSDLNSDFRSSEFDKWAPNAQKLAKMASTLATASQSMLGMSRSTR